MFRLSIFPRRSMFWGRKNPPGAQRRVFSTSDSDLRPNMANGPSHAQVSGRFRLQRWNTAYGQNQRFRGNKTSCSWYVTSVKCADAQQEKHEPSLNPRNLPRRRQDATASASASAPHKPRPLAIILILNSFILAKLQIFFL